MIELWISFWATLILANLMSIQEETKMSRIYLGCAVVCMVTYAVCKIFGVE